MQIIEAEQFGAQAEVTMQRRQMCFGLLDQRVIDGRRYRVTIQRLCQRIRIMADFGIRAAVLEHPVERGAESILVRLPFAEERSEEHTSELQSLMRISYAVFCLKKKKQKT